MMSVLSVHVPICAWEKLAQLILYVDSFDESEISPAKLIEIKTKLFDIKNSICKEKSDDGDVSMKIEDVEDSLDSGDSFHFGMTLKRLMMAIRPLNCEELFTRVKLTDRTRSIIEGRDIVLLVGDSGAGKSTLIQFLAGAKMEAINIGGLRHICAMNVPLEGLDMFVSSPHARSETRSISAIELKVDVDGTEDYFWLTDTPGFSDTEGVELDIANGVSTANAIQSCRSVKVVVLISNQGIGDRSQGIVKLLHVIIKMVKNVKDHVDAFTFVFTKFDKGLERHVKTLLHEVYQNLKTPESTNPSFVALFNSLRKRDIIILDPVNDEPARLLEHLSRCGRISNPAEVFQTFAAKESLQTVKVNSPPQPPSLTVDRHLIL